MQLSMWLAAMRLGGPLHPLLDHLLQLEEQLLYSLAHLHLTRLEPLEPRRLRVLALLGLIRARGLG